MSINIEKILKKFDRVVKRLTGNKAFLIYLCLYSLLLLTFSLLRDAVADETYYLRETLLISELIKKGIWIGDYGVGLHGFLFKIPVALAFIILGKPSVWIATLFTIGLSLATIYLFYKLLKNYFVYEKFSLLTTILFSMTLYFISTSVSFYRDIPALFTVVLFLFLFLKKSNKIWIGLTFLLMLDAKEHVFLTIASLYVIYLLVEFIRSVKIEGLIKSFWQFIKDSIIVYILPLSWIILMFTTSLVPINMFIASIGDVVKVEKNWVSSQFSTSVASANLLGGESKEIPKTKAIFDTSCNNNYQILDNGSVEGNRTSEFVCDTFKVIDFGLSYLGKILYPRTFSFISIPKIVVLPAIMIAIKKFVEWWKKKDEKYLLPIILIFNILIVIFRASHGRYLLPVAPLFALFFILFLKDFYKNIKFSRNVLIATTVFVIVGLYFESTYIIPKILLEFSLLAVFWTLYCLRNNHKKVKQFLMAIMAIILSVGMFFTYLAFSYSIGQIGNFIDYGYNRETFEISQNFSKNEKIWVNEYTSIDLLRLYRKEIYIEPEWNWKLQEWLPKSELLKTTSEKRTYEFPIVNLEEFKMRVYSENIEKVVILDSEIGEFLYEEYLDEFIKADWLELTESIQLKNKVMYVFNVMD